MIRDGCSRSEGRSRADQRRPVRSSPRSRGSTTTCASRRRRRSPRRHVPRARWHLIAFVGLAVGLLAACGSDEGAVVEADAANALVIEAGDIYYEPEAVEAAAGPIRFTLENVGVVEHDLVVEEVGDVEVVHAEAGETVTGTIELELGTYTFYCSIEGHRTAGQEGTLEVG